jgi:hypothetical protein
MKHEAHRNLVSLSFDWYLNFFLLLHTTLNLIETIIDVQ